MSIDTPHSPFAAALRQAIDECRAAGSTVLPELSGKRILGHFGIAVPQSGELAADLSIPAGLRAPFVLKAISPTLVHKSDAGGVKLNLSADQVAATATAMRESLEEQGYPVTGFLIEEQAPAGLEIVVGAVRTPGVGWALMVGIGGIFVEVLGDVSFGLAPVSRGQIEDMLDELAGKALLDGARGTAPINRDALLDIIVAFAGSDGLLSHMPDDITEIDLNPIIAGSDRAVAVDARFVVGTAEPSAQAPQTRTASDFARLLAPQAIAVLGASTKGRNGANLFIQNLGKFGFTGQIFPVHPSGDEVEGLPSFTSLAEVPTTVDYAYVALPGARVAAALAEGAGKVRFAQVISSGFGEVPEGIEMERELVDVVRQAGIRLIGPNCLGMHTSEGHVSFIPGASMNEGTVSVISQSGGLSVDILRLGEARGIDYRSVISMGNGADVSAAELLEFFLDDPKTNVIGLYLESLADGRAVLDVLDAHSANKPVVLLAGGRTADGSRAATSHTGALSGNHRLWPALARQAGIMLVDNMKQFLDALLVFELSTGETDAASNDIILFGNGGGASVLAADALARVGLMTPTLPDVAIDELNSLGLPPGNGLLNPIDAPATTLLIDAGGVAEPILDAALKHTAPAAVISHFNVGILFKNLPPGVGDVTAGLIDAIGKARDKAAHRAHHLLVLKTDGSPETDAQIALYRAQAHALGLPAFDEIEDAAAAAQLLVRHHRNQNKTRELALAGKAN